ncbi:MAG: AsnC family transcriptional regulator [Clostridiales bacterium]|nr:AsnC family transcriptional regulator [Clostridiales bacterium]
MDDKDKELLNQLQIGLPLSERPYGALALQLGLSEEDVLHRIRKMKEENIIRRIGGVFDSSKLGYQSTLCAMSVPAGKTCEAARVINGFEGVTHNYLRDGDYNIWFTVIAQSKARLADIVSEIQQRTGIEVHSLPAMRKFKIDARFHT